MAFRHSHDAFFRTLIGDPVRADVLIRRCLPPETAALLSDEPFSPLPDTLISDTLRTLRTDSLFMTGLKEGGMAYALLEHKSTPDTRTPLQISEYIIGILRSHDRLQGRGDPQPRPLVIPIVVYHGAAKWTAPRSARDLAAETEDLFRYHLLDLGRIPDPELSSDTSLRGGLALLKYTMDQDPPKEELVAALGALRDLRVPAIEYMVEKYQLPREALEQIIREADPELWRTLMPTVAEGWKEEGKAEGRVEGRAEGRVEGKAETLLRLLERRFGTVSEDASTRVLAAPVEDLDVWLDAILSAPTIEDIFRNGAVH